MIFWHMYYSDLSNF